MSGCTHPATTAVADSSVACRSIVRMKTEQTAPRDATDRLHLDLQSVTALGEGRYQLVVLSRTDADCAEAVVRLNADEDVSYAVADERKRSH